VRAVVELAGEYLALAGTAGAVAAAVGEREALAQRRLEDGFVVLDGELVSAGLDGAVKTNGLSPGRDTFTPLQA